MPDANPTEDVFEQDRQLADARAERVACEVRRLTDTVVGIGASGCAGLVAIFMVLLVIAAQGC